MNIVGNHLLPSLFIASKLRVIYVVERTISLSDIIL